MASAQSLLSLGDLPKFRGAPRQGEQNFQPGVSIQTFLRAIDNHIEQHKIKGNDKKVQLLFSQVDKESGDGLNTINCFAGRQVDYEIIKRNLLDFYPSFTLTEFRHTSRMMQESNVNSPTLRCGMTTLENYSRGLVEAYLSSASMEEVDITMETKLDQSVCGKRPKILLSDVLQNFILHHYISTQVSNPIYDKLAGITPMEEATTFVSNAVKTAARDRLFKTEGKRKPDMVKDPETMFQTHVNQLSTGKSVTVADKQCFQCQRYGHLKRDCKSLVVCKYCNKLGHSLKECRKLARDKALKKCSSCKRQGHVEKECAKFCKTCGKFGHAAQNCRQKTYQSNKIPYQSGRQPSHQINMVNEGEGQFENPDIEYEEEPSDEGEQQ